MVQDESSPKPLNQGGSQWLEYQRPKRFDETTELQQLPRSAKIDRPCISGIVAFASILIWIPWWVFCFDFEYTLFPGTPGQPDSRLHVFIMTTLVLSPLVIALTSGSYSLVVARRRRNVIGKLGFALAIIGTIVVLKLIFMK
jgi:hypothetical protein